MPEATSVPGAIANLPCQRGGTCEREGAKEREEARREREGGREERNRRKVTDGGERVASGVGPGILMLRVSTVW